MTETGRNQVFLLTGSILMILLGLARGTGGVLLLLRGAAIDTRIQAGEPAVVRIGLGLLVLGISLIIAGLGILRRRQSFWWLGLVGTVVFVGDGAVNGTVLYGHPGDQGTLVNGVAAILILTCLWLGKPALRRRD